MFDAPVLNGANRQLLVGSDVGTGRAVHIPLSALRSSATAISGSSGSGKSFMLRHLIGELVRHRQSLSVVDPHGELAEYALWKLRRSGVRPERIIYIDLSDERYAPAVNPLMFAADPAEAASLACDCFARAWNSSMEETPRLSRVLSATFRTLIDAGLSIAEAPELLAVNASELRCALRERVRDQLVRQEWIEYEALSRAEKLATVESARNRLRRVLQLESVRRMLGQTENVLNLRQVMDHGRFLLLNLAGISAPEVQKLVASLTLSGFFHAAKRRDTRRRRDHFLIVDEFSELATPDVALSLDQTRKMGLYWILAFQRFAQLTRFNPDLLSAVLTNAKNRFVLAGLSRDDAELMSGELYTGEIRTDRAKHVQYSTKFRPIDTTFEVVTESGSESEGESASWGTSSGSSDSGSDSETLTYRGPGPADSDDEMHGHSAGRQWSSGESESSGGATTTTRTSGWSKSIVPVTKHQEFIEEAGRQYYSLDEERHRCLAKVHSLAHREVLIRLHNGPVRHVRTPDVQPERIDGRFRRFHEEVMRRCPEVQPAEVVVRQIEDRRRLLAQFVEDHEAGNRPFAVKSFRE